MTDAPRDELGWIAGRLRRVIERERAGGTGELMATSVASARRASGMPSGAGSNRPASATTADAPADRYLAAGAAFAASPAEVAPSMAAPAPAAEAESLFDLATAKAPDRPHDATSLHPIDSAARAAIEAEARPLLERIAAEVRACQKCALWQGRTQGVPGVGSALSGIAFVGEGPGADEDRLGEPFVGRAGQLLDRILVAMNEGGLIPGLRLDRTTVFIGNIVHCRPPENRVPLPVEVEQSFPYLQRQLAALKPRIVCCLGKTAAEAMLGTKASLGSMRGRIYRWQGSKLLVTYHPAACLRNPGYKRPVWEDMQLLAREYLTN